MSVTIAVTIENFGISQFTNYEFNSMFKLGDKAYGVNEDGIFFLCGDTDDGADIDAYFISRTIDFEFPARIRNFYIGYESKGPLMLTVQVDETNVEQYEIPANLRGLVAQGGKTRIKHSQIGRYFSFKVANINGKDFSVNMIEALPLGQARKPRR